MLNDKCALRGKRILVTGGTGFIGSRLVERLVTEHEARVRVLARNLCKAVQVARFGREHVEIMPGDVSIMDDVRRAVSGCDIVFNCAVASGGKEIHQQVTVGGTKNVLEAAEDACVSRVVHLSSSTVYGIAPDGDVDEDSPRRLSGNNYADSKIEIEDFVLDTYRSRNLPAVVIQPTAVYGPYSPLWVVNALKQLQSGRVILINGGSGLRNLVYIDDVVNALLLAAVRDEAVGEAFLITDGNPVTWQQFYAKYEVMLGVSRTVAMSEQEAMDYYASTHPGSRSLFREIPSILLKDPAARGRILCSREVMPMINTLRKVLPPRIRSGLKRKLFGRLKATCNGRSGKENLPIYPLSPAAIKMYAAKVRFRIDKAQRLLGYEPVYDYEAGMARAEQWARWANLL